MLGDAAALPALGSIAAGDPDSLESKEARSAIEAIRKGEPQHADVTRLRQEITDPLSPAKWRDVRRVLSSEEVSK